MAPKDNKISIYFQQSARLTEVLNWIELFNPNTFHVTILCSDCTTWTCVDQITPRKNCWHWQHCIRIWLRNIHFDLYRLCVWTKFAYIFHIFLTWMSCQFILMRYHCEYAVIYCYTEMLPHNNAGRLNPVSMPTFHFRSARMHHISIKLNRIFALSPALYCSR